MHRHFFLHASNGGSFDWSAVTAAFLGAFTAAVLGLAAFVITKRRERYVIHKNGLIKLERTLGRHLNEIDTVRHAMHNIKQILAEHKIPINRLYSLKIPDGLDLEIGSIDLVNRLFGYQMNIDLINLNFADYNHLLNRYDEVAVASMSARLPKEAVDLGQNMLSQLEVQVNRLDQTALELYMYARIHLRKLREEESWFNKSFNVTWDFNITTQEVSSETEKYKSELQPPKTN